MWGCGSDLYQSLILDEFVDNLTAVYQSPLKTGSFLTESSPFAI